MGGKQMNHGAAAIAAIQEKLGGSSAEQVVEWALSTYGRRVAVACSFSMEDVILVHMAVRTGLPCRVVALDTGRLHEETLWVAAQVEQRWGLQMEWYFPDADDVEALVRQAGPFSFRNSLEERRRCCDIRKRRPLQRALADTPAWLTGLRREQGQTRSSLHVAQWDDGFGGLVKLNPLVDWSDQQVADCVAGNLLPTSLLYGEGFTSIGCAPCTRATRPGEHPRAGRWWWEDPSHGECGLHPLGGRK